jgi:hypothetical protein
LVRKYSRATDRALAIPDPELRCAALIAVQRSWGRRQPNTVLAGTVAIEDRAAFVQTAIAYELIVGYLGLVSEQPVTDPWANTLQLHRALRNSLTLARPREPDYYMFHSHRDDGGFLSAQVSEFRRIFSALSSAAVVSERAKHLAALCAEARASRRVEQARCGSAGSTPRIDAVAARNAGLSRDEVLAVCETSAPLIALLPLAVRSGTTAAEVDERVSAYFREAQPTATS